MKDSDKSPDAVQPTGIGTVLRGNFAPKRGDSEKLAVAASADDADKTISEFEQKARGQIGGSIAFVTRLKNKDADVLFFDEEE